VGGELVVVLHLGGDSLLHQPFHRLYAVVLGRQVEWSGPVSVLGVLRPLEDPFTAAPCASASCTPWLFPVRAKCSCGNPEGYVMEASFTRDDDVNCACVCRAASLISWRLPEIYLKKEADNSTQINTTPALSVISISFKGSETQETPTEGTSGEDSPQDSSECVVLQQKIRELQHDRLGLESQVSTLQAALDKEREKLDKNHQEYTQIISEQEKEIHNLKINMVSWGEF
ncbi:hypothetical protein Hamer_G010462, partial [Homarus americanus]